MYNLILFLYLRDRVALYHAVGILAISGYLFCQENMISLLFGFPGLSAHDNFVIGAYFNASAFIMYIHFSRYFLATAHYCPKHDRLLALFEGVFVLVFGLTILYHLGWLGPWYRYVSNLGALFLLLSMISVSASALYEKIPTAPYFVLPNLILVGFGLIFLGQPGFLNVFDAGYFGQLSLKIGLVCHTALFSVALAARISTLLVGIQKERLENETNKRLRLEEIQRLIYQKNRDLFHKVKKRTYELQQSNEELNATLQMIKEHKNEIEKQNRDIKASITYAQRIQTAVLPSQRQVQSFFPNSFVLFRPRDHVSGDFYWIAAKGFKRLIIAADCTGHGIPGALMAMIGDTLLKQIINIHQVYSPECVLQELHRYLVRSLNQTESNIRDGMELAVCLIDDQKRKLYFAGARRPLVYIQNQQMFIIRGDRREIGGINHGDSRNYQRHVIDLSVPTSFYIFSDGYQDQMGGPRNKKFMSRQLHSVLMQIHNLPMPEQQRMLEDTLQNWMNDTQQPQIDDVLLIGVRI
ncbi:MAG: SpoIIE family protein phosphatase [Bacteroidia bacterium]|nr:SpoIIE family protein phosphatase [Bacteroidia bacterium]